MPLQCSHPNCSKQPSYGVVGSTGAARCSEHSLDSMVDDVVNKKCSHPNCSKQPYYYGVAGSTRVERYSKHFLDGMVDVVNKKCSHPNCSKRPSYGVAGSTRAERCSKHSLMGMVDVVNKKCSHLNCPKQPSYRVTGSKRAERYSKHSLMGMVDVISEKCSHPNCSTQPSYGMASSKKAEMCAEHALDGMINVRSKKCSHPHCSKRPNNSGMTGSRNAERCLEHGLDRMMVDIRMNECGSLPGVLAQREAAAAASTREEDDYPARCAVKSEIIFSPDDELTPSPTGPNPSHTTLQGEEGGAGFSLPDPAVKMTERGRQGNVDGYSQADGKADMEISSRICRAWKCFRRYSEAIYDRRRIDHQLKRTDRPLSYAEVLLRTGCEETIEATVRKRRLCFAGFVMRMEDHRLPKRVLLGTLATGKGYRGGQESDWVSRLGEDLVAFGMEDEKEGEKWKTSAMDQEEWFGKIEDGVARFMRKWHAQEKAASAKRQLARAALAAKVDAGDQPPTGRKRQNDRGAPGEGKKQKPETAAAESRAAEAVLVAQHIPD
eukprot:g13897.t1